MHFDFFDRLQVDKIGLSLRLEQDFLLLLVIILELQRKVTRVNAFQIEVQNYLCLR